MSPISTAERRRAVILTGGSFGAAVADRLHDLSDLPHLDEVTTQAIDSGTHSSLWPHADLLVLATSHERPRVAEAIDRASFAWGMPWLEVCLEPTEIRVGPVVVPSRTACYQCFLKRRRQHRRIEPPSPGAKHPSGFAAHHVGIAAALARQAVGEALSEQDPAVLGGTVRRFNLVTGITSRSSVVAVDRCPRCRERRTSEELWQCLAAWRESA